MRQVNFKEILLIFLILGSAYGYFFSQHDSNTNSRLALVKAIVEEKRFEIDTYQNSTLDTIDKAYYNGHYYSDKAPGSSFLAVPIYYVMLRLGILLKLVIKISAMELVLTLLVVSLPNAFLAICLYLFARDVETNSSRFALLITLAVCLGTPLFFYSSTFYSHALIGFFLFAAFYLWFRMRQNGKINLWGAALSGFLAGYAIITEYPAAIIVAVLGMYILWVLWKEGRLLRAKALMALIGGALPPLVLLAIYNYSVFGSALAVAYMHENVDQFSNVMQVNMGFGLPNLQALFDMTFHTTMGIFWQSPILLLAFPGWVRMWQTKKFRAEAVFSFAAILIYFLIFSGYYWWWGGLAFTPRYVVVTLPFFIIPLAFLGRKFHKVFFALAIVSIAQMFVVTASAYNNPQNLYDLLINISTDHYYPMFENSTIYSVYLPNFLAGHLAPNLGASLFHLHSYPSLIPFFAVEVILLGFLFRVSRRPSQIENDLPHAA